MIQTWMQASGQCIVSKPAVSLADAGLAALGTRGKDPRQREGLVLQLPECRRPPVFILSLEKVRIKITIFEYM